MTSKNLPVILLTGFIIAYIGLFGMLATRQHLAFETNALDLGNYDQALWNALHGRGFALTTLPTLAFNRMGLHVEPILYLIVPLYRLWPHPILLLWLQTLALGLAAWPLYILACRRTGSAWGGLAVALAYLLLPATQSVNLFDFHAVALSPPFMLAGLVFLDNAGGFWPGDGSIVNPKSQIKNYLLAGLFLALALATKEDISLHVFLLGLYVAIFRRQWRLGGAIAGLGLVWALVSFGLVIPAYRVGGEQSAYVKYFADLGDTPLEIALSPFTKPAAVWHLFFRPENIAALGMLTLPFGLLNLIGLPVFALSAPALAISLLSNNPLQQQLETWHYAAPMLPFISLAAADGIARLTTYDLRFTKEKLRLAVVLPLALVAFSLGYHYLRGYSPVARPFYWPPVTAHHRLGDELAAGIEPSAPVSVQAELAPRLTQRQQVTIWTGNFPTEADVVMVDVAHPKFINRDNAHAGLLSTMIYNDKFGLVTSRDGYLILRRGAERLPTQVGFQTFLFGDKSLCDAPELARFGDFASLVGAETHLHREDEPQMTLYFCVRRQTEQDYFIRLYLLAEDGTPEGATIFQQPALVWWPTHLWQPGDVIKVRFNTLPWWTADGNHPRFGYAVGISRDSGDPQADPWNLDLRLPVTAGEALPGNLVHVQDFYRLAGMAYQN